MKFFLTTTLIVATCLWPGIAQAQEKKTTISVVDFYIPSEAAIAKRQNEKADDNPYYTRQQPAASLHQKLALLPSIVSEFFGKDDRFTLVDRKSHDLVHKERELQKSEDFLDGYVVAQGQGIGASHLVSGEFDMVTNTLSLALYSVGEQTIVGTETVDLNECLFANVINKPIREPVLEGVRRLCQKPFPLLMPVVEIAEQKKDEAKTVLLAAGLGRGLRKGMKLDIKTKETLSIEGGEQVYFKTIGSGTVDKVEDQNFSILKLETGQKEVKTKLDAGVKLYCTFQL
jgi:hypothetical protein